MLQFPYQINTLTETIMSYWQWWGLGYLWQRSSREI